MITDSIRTLFFLYIRSLNIMNVEILSIIIDRKLYLRNDKFFEPKREMKSSRCFIHLCQPNS